MKKLIQFPFTVSFIFLIILGFSLPARAQTIVCLETTLGDICMELLETEAPVAAQNFLAYVNQGSYRTSFFHASAQDGPAYVQAGRYADTGAGGLDGIQEIFRRPAISNESSVSNTRGMVAIVPDDPANPDSATSQFLINVTDNPSLDALNGGYTVFARIIGDGMTLVDTLAEFPVVAFDNDGLSRVPVIGQEVPVQNSPRVDIFDATIFDGDLDDFENGDSGDGGSDGGDGGDGGSDGGDGGTDGGDGETPTPGEGEILYEDAVCVDTNAGEFCMELLPEAAPLTVANFLSYINNGRYDDTIVHRSVPNFVIQAGGYFSNPLGSEIPKAAAVQNEFSLSNVRGTVAMARLGGQVNSATSEWFVNLVDNSQLDSVDGGFTVFANIISGMSVVDAIGSLPRANLQSSLGGAFGEVPLTDQDSDGVHADDLVLVHRIYVTDVITDGSDVDPGNGGGSGVTTTANYSTLSRALTMPVKINDVLYRISMYQDTEEAGYVFYVDTARIFTLTDTGQETATMDLDAGTLHIPSLGVGGLVFNDVEFEMVEYETLSFKLRSYTRAAD